MSAVSPNEDPPIEENKETRADNPSVAEGQSSAPNIENLAKSGSKPSEIDAKAGGDTAPVIKETITKQCIENIVENPDVSKEPSNTKESLITLSKTTDENDGLNMDIQEEDIELKWEDDEEIDEEKLLADEEKLLADENIITGDENKSEEVLGSTEEVSEENTKGNYSKGKENDNITAIANAAVSNDSIVLNIDEITMKDAEEKSIDTIIANNDDTDLKAVEITLETYSDNKEPNSSQIEMIQTEITEKKEKVLVAEVDNKLDAAKLDQPMDIDKLDKEILDQTIEDDLKATANSTIIENDENNKTNDVTDITSSLLEERPIEPQEHNLKQPDMMIDIPTQELLDLPDDSGTTDSKDSVDFNEDNMDTEIIESIAEKQDNDVEKELIDDIIDEKEKTIKAVDEINVALSEKSVADDISKDQVEQNMENKDTVAKTDVTPNIDEMSKENIATIFVNDNKVPEIEPKDEIIKENPLTTEPVEKSEIMNESVTMLSSKPNLQIKDVISETNIENLLSNDKKESQSDSDAKSTEDPTSETKEQSPEVLETQPDILESSKVNENTETIDKTESVIENPTTIDSIEHKPDSSEELSLTSKDVKALSSEANNEEMEVPDSTETVQEGLAASDKSQSLLEPETTQDVSINSQLIEKPCVHEDKLIDSSNQSDMTNETVQDSAPKDIKNSPNELKQSSDIQDTSIASGLKLESPDVKLELEDQPMDTSDGVPEMTDSLGLLAESSWKEEDEEQETSGNDEGDDDEEYDDADESNQMTIDNSEDSNAQISETDAPKLKQTEEQESRDAFSNIGKENLELDGNDGMEGMEEKMDDDTTDLDKDAVDVEDDIVCDEMDLAGPEDEPIDDTLEPDTKIKDDGDKDIDKEKPTETSTTDAAKTSGHDSSLLKSLLIQGKSETPSKTRNLSLSTANSRHVVNIVELEGSSSDDDQKTTKALDTKKKEQKSDGTGNDVTTINIPSEIEIMSSGGNTSEILTKEGEIVISGVPKPPPSKPARLNTGEVTIKTASTTDTIKIPTKILKDASTDPNLNSEVFNLDSDEDESATAKDIPPPEDNKRKKCINTACASDSGTQYYLASPSVIAYYDSNKIEKKKMAMVCANCLDIAYRRAERLVEGVKNFTPLMELDMGKLCQELVEISDSDSESELDATEGEEEVIGKEGAKLLEEQLAGLMNETWSKYKMDARLQCVEDELSEELAKLEKDSAELDAMLKECQQNTDKIRSELYATFEVERRDLSPILIYDTPTNLYTCLESSAKEERVVKRRLASFSEVPSKRGAFAPLDHDSKVPKPRLDSKGDDDAIVSQRGAYAPLDRETKVPKPRLDSKGDDDKDVSVVTLSAESAPPELPPPGEPVRPPLAVGGTVYAMRNAFGTWLKAKVVEIYPRGVGNNSSPYTLCKVKHENKGKQYTKTVQARSLAYNEPCEVRMTIGTRIIALFKGSDVKRDAFFSGVVAEVPNPVNNYRYLVFFDDGYAQYVQHCDTRLVCEYSPLVWEEVHPFSREFVRQYLMAYPERPMVRLHMGQKLKCEWNGQWLTCKVLKVDASLAQIHFEGMSRTEWIYRGSTRLLPLYRELQAAERTRGRPLPRNRQVNQVNMPYVEYTRSEEKQAQPQSTAAAQQEELRRQQRAVAKKSVGAPLPPPAAPPAARPAADHHTSRVVYYTPKHSVKPYKMSAHSCGPHCRRSDVLALKDLRTYNPLAKPLLSGWERQIARYKGSKEVLYRAPCGRRVRSVSELHRYLQLTQSDLPVDLFDFAPGTHCLAEFVLNTCIISKKDLSNGKENVPVPCINYYDTSLPEFCSYNTERTPTEGVPLNIDPEFLCGCDCTDDCEDKSKCACWQMTLEGARTIGFEGDVGYKYKRLLEPLPTGIYECNSRCKCKSTCLNRVAQYPLQLKLQVFKTSNRGWGIRALNDIPKGAFICVYAGNLLTDATANLDGLNEGDEYLAELDYIEVVEQIKEGYEDDVPDADKDLDKKESSKEGSSSSELSSSEEEEPSKNEENDGDFQPGYLPPTSVEFNKRLRKRDKKTKRDNKEKDRNNAEEKKSNTEKKDADNDDCITISDDEEVREPSRFTAEGMGDSGFTSKYKSVREHFGKDEKCYIMDAKVQGNIGRYLNHSCTPNVFVQNVFVDTHDPRFPWVGFFALTPVKAGSELTWNYNYDVGSVPGKVLYCYCGATNCRGRLL